MTVAMRSSPLKVAPRSIPCGTGILWRTHVELQDGAVKKDYRAHLAEGAEYAEWWARASETWPDYATYQAKTKRKIPVFVLESMEN